MSTIKAVYDKFKSLIFPSGWKYHCICCDKELQWDECTYSEKSNSPVIDGICITTNGNWGSTVLDGSTAYFAICDECFKAKAKNILVHHYDYEGTYLSTGDSFISFNQPKNE